MSWWWGSAGNKVCQDDDYLKEKSEAWRGCWIIMLMFSLFQQTRGTTAEIGFSTISQQQLQQHRTQHFEMHKSNMFCCCWGKYVTHMISDPFPDDGDLCPAHPQLRLLGILPGSRQVAGQSLQGGKGLLYKNLFALKGHLEKSCVLLSALRGNKRFLQAVHFIWIEVGLHRAPKIEFTTFFYHNVLHISIQVI